MTRTNLVFGSLTFGFVFDAIDLSLKTEHGCERGISQANEDMFEFAQNQNVCPLQPAQLLQTVIAPISSPHTLLTPHHNQLCNNIAPAEARASLGSEIRTQPESTAASLAGAGGGTKAAAAVAAGAAGATAAAAGATGGDGARTAPDPSIFICWRDRGELIEILRPRPTITGPD